MVSQEKEERKATPVMLVRKDSPDPSGRREQLARLDQKANKVTLDLKATPVMWGPWVHKAYAERQGWRVPWELMVPPGRRASKGSVVFPALLDLPDPKGTAVRPGFRVQTALPDLRVSQVQSGQEEPTEKTALMVR